MKRPKTLAMNPNTVPRVPVATLESLIHSKDRSGHSDHAAPRYASFFPEKRRPHPHLIRGCGRYREAQTVAPHGGHVGQRTLKTHNQANQQQRGGTSCTPWRHHGALPVAQDAQQVVLLLLEIRAFCQLLNVYFFLSWSDHDRFAIPNRDVTTTLTEDSVCRIPKRSRNPRGGHLGVG